MSTIPEINPKKMNGWILMHSKDICIKWFSAKIHSISLTIKKN